MCRPKWATVRMFTPSWMTAFEEGVAAQFLGDGHGMGPPPMM